jgi:general secretion pathway protein B
MSLILDALKKSEAERQRGQVPNLLSPVPASASHPQAQRYSRLPWLILIVALIAMLVFSYFYANRRVDSSTNVIAAATNEPSAQTPPVRPLSEPANTTAPPAPPKAVLVEKPIAAHTETMPTEPIIPAKAAEPSQSESVATATEAKPRIASLSELSTEQRQQLPTLKLSMHVYSSEASKRFAIIDGQRVNEGSVLGSVVIEQIRQDGVVLSVQGQSYLLPRP